ncbi:hypothetical protein BGW38_007874 [Lunasporangiospora selenospora]|uniref:Uncharacterized protein n=1 Tax=Lunasporangiospora selenospora TaxID=979761 RepID=A0A9P6KA00_9FUNG|nr:hypothetical protein BGW38_007874 [Lunasporangiospora selenospora]
MSQISKRQEALRKAEEMFALALIDSDSDLEDMAMFKYAMINESRYFERPRRKKRDDYFFTVKFDSYTETEFRQRYRTTRTLREQSFRADYCD